MKTIQKITLGLFLLMGNFSFKATATDSFTKKITDVKFDAATAKDEKSFITQLNAMDALSKISFVSFDDLKTLKDNNVFTEAKIFSSNKLTADAVIAFNKFFKRLDSTYSYTTLDNSKAVSDLTTEAIKHIPSKVFNVDVGTFIKDAATLKTALDVLMGYNDMITSNKFIVVADTAVANVLSSENFDAAKILDGTTQKLSANGAAFFNYLKDKLQTATAIAAAADLTATTNVVKEIFAKVQALETTKGITAPASGNQKPAADKAAGGNQTPPADAAKEEELGFFDKCMAGLNPNSDKVDWKYKFGSYGFIVAFVAAVAGGVYVVTKQEVPENPQLVNNEGIEVNS